MRRFFINVSLIPLKIMETFNFILAPIFATLGIFFLVIGLQRAFHSGFPYNIHDQTEKDILRDNFFGTLAGSCALFCIVPSILPIKSWHAAIPIGLAFVLFMTFGVTIRAYLSAMMAHAMTKAIKMSNRFFDQSSDSGRLEWYEFTPFAFIAGWVVYYLMYLATAWLAKFEVASTNPPIWSIVISLAFGMLVATIVTITIYQRLKNTR